MSLYQSGMIDECIELREANLKLRTIHLEMMENTSLDTDLTGAQCESGLLNTDRRS
jgi:hypothetical protein